MKSEFLHELMAGVKKEDPIGFSGQPFDFDDLRRLACLNVYEVLQSQSGEPAAEVRELIMAATVVRLVLENMVLNARIAILNRREASPDTQLV